MSLGEAVYARFGEIGPFMNNAATRVGGGVLGDIEDWQRALDVNFWSVVHGVPAFVPRMLERGSPALVIDTAPSRAAPRSSSTPAPSRGSPTGPAISPTT